MTHLASTLSAGQNQITIEGSPTDWVAGDEIVIATTSADPWETETFKIESVNDKTVTLNASARFEHIAETFSYIYDSIEKSYDIKAEVSMLTRNIKIIGEDYPGLFTESFGARVLITGVGSGSDRGYARIQNVEFFHTGQEGFIDNYDPRYSLAFLNTGTVDTIKPSIVKRNTFHNGFNTAIGVFGAAELDVVENTIHHTVGPGIRVEGNDITLESNLVMLTRTRSVYQDRLEGDLRLWKAAIEVNLAKSPILRNNIVAGSERAGYRIDGHSCSSNSEVQWGWNTARATLHGVFLNKDGLATCTHFGKFNIHSAHDNGVYCQIEGSVKMSDILITDSNFGFSAIIYGPSSLSHKIQNKQVTIENCVVVAVSKPGYCPALRRKTDYLVNAPNARPERRTDANEFTRAAILWPAFISGQNTAPAKPFLGSMSYPAIGGKTVVNNVTFVNFGDSSCSPDHSIFLTNLEIEDYLHPIETSKLRFINSPEDTYIYFHRPSLDKINPSDCVDMECDGMKKALIVDKDGTMLGSAGSSAFPQAEFEWDGDPRRGLGDYRIPKTLLTNLDQSKIDPKSLVPNKGIIRANTKTASCSQKNAWNGHKCSGYHHGILVVESLDADSETRRLSPVALKVDNYIDLNNGPQDHGWCAGYTCQERLSTFWMIVAMFKTYDLHFSGVAPEKLRLRLLNEESTTKMVLKIYYSRPQRMDVYVNNKYCKPLNDVEKSDPSQYFPTIDHLTGDNYYDRPAQTVHVTLGGGNTVVEIREALVVVLTLKLPALSPDEFFDNGKLVENLASFLKIPSHKIRLVNAVREGTSQRKRRQAKASYTAILEIGDPPAETIDDTSSTVTASPVTEGTTPVSASSITREDLTTMTAAIANALQQHSLSEVLGTEVSSLSVVEPRPEAVKNANSTNSTEDLNMIEQYFIPAALRVVQQPHSGTAGNPLSPTLSVTGIDAGGKDIILGHSSDRWHATVMVENGNASAKLSGATNVVFNDEGLAVFENLTISLIGSFVLRISVTYPSGQSALTVLTESFTLIEATTPATISTTTATEELNLTKVLNKTGQLNQTGTPAAAVTMEDSSTTNEDKITQNYTIDTNIGNLALVITCSLFGGPLLVAAIVALILKCPCSRPSNSTTEYRTELQPWNDRYGNTRTQTQVYPGPLTRCGGGTQSLPLGRFSE